MDAAHGSPHIREHSVRLGHVPLVDHNPRGGEKVEFAPHQAQRFKERSTVERVNARLKDEFGAARVNVRGYAKVSAHLMFAVLVLSADPWLRWVT
jgi:IS5 family transposase